MAKHWPYHSVIANISQEQQREILEWCWQEFGDYSFQHWSSSSTHTCLTVYFCDKFIKTQFDLTWSWLNPPINDIMSYLWG